MKPLTILLTGILMASLAECSTGDQPEGFAVMGRKAASHLYLGEASPVAPAPVGEGNLSFPVLPVLASSVISPHSPVPAPRRATLFAADCPGQYGPMTFLVWSAVPCDLSVTMPDLKSSAGGTIGKENFDVRVVRYVKIAQDEKTHVIPLLLESLDKKTLPASGRAQIWVTYFIPPDASAGAYTGALTLALGGRRTFLPVELKVYPFKLAEPDVNLYIYQAAPDDPKHQDLLRKQWVDQRCHGMNCSQLPVPVTRDGDLLESSLALSLDVYKSVGFARPFLFVDLYNRITAEWLNAPDKSIGMSGAWFRYYPFGEKLDARFVRTVRTICDEAAARGLRIVLSVADEPGSHPWTTKAAQHYDDLIKARIPEVLRELTVGGGWAMKRDEDQLWKDRINIWTTNRWLPDKLQLVRRNDPSAAVQIYNMAGGGSVPGGTQAARLFYGFFNWKAQAAGAAQWCYYHSATPADNYTWPAEDPAQGSVPTLRWEAVREGAKDRRYLATLENLLERNKGALADKAGVVTQAKKLLHEISDQVELPGLETSNPGSGGPIHARPPGTYEQWRAKIADYIEKLQSH